MAPRQPLTKQLLLELLEKERCAFTDRYEELLVSQETALKKAEAVAKPVHDGRRNASRTKASAILNDIRNRTGHEVFILTALATCPSQLGASRLDDYIPAITSWWNEVNHPYGLSRLAELRLATPPQEKASEVPLPTYQTNQQTSQHTDAGNATLKQQPFCSSFLVSSFLNPSKDKASSPQIDGGEDRAQDERPSKRVRITSPPALGTPSMREGDKYIPFTFTSRDTIEALPEPFRTGVKTSNLWSSEKHNAFNVTNSLSLYMPAMYKADGFLVIRVGFDQSFNILESLGLGDVPSVPPNGSRS